MAPNPKERHLMDSFDPRKTIIETHNLTPHPLTGRLIDNHPGKRTIPMKLLVLGMPRTGTMTIFTALEMLGYKPYHMVKAMSAPKSNLDVWREGLRAKFDGEGEKWGREEFDKILGQFDAVADVPCVTFSEELIAAYPDAKVLLNGRDVNKWLESMDGTAGTVFKWWGWEMVAPWDKALAEPFWKFAKVVMPATLNAFDDFSPNSEARQAFLAHYERVRRACPKERLLEYDVKQGWGPLCEFVGKEVPEEAFPRVNDKTQFLLVLRVMWWLAFGKMVGKISLMAAPVVVVGAAVWVGRVPSLGDLKGLVGGM